MVLMAYLYGQNFLVIVIYLHTRNYFLESLLPISVDPDELDSRNVVCHLMTAINGFAIYVIFDHCKIHPKH